MMLIINFLCAIVFSAMLMPRYITRQKAVYTVSGSQEDPPPELSWPSQPFSLLVCKNLTNHLHQDREPVLGSETTVW